LSGGERIWGGGEQSGTGEVERKLFPRILHPPEKPIRVWEEVGERRKGWRDGEGEEAEVKLIEKKRSDGTFYTTSSSCSS